MNYKYLFLSIQLRSRRLKISQMTQSKNTLLDKKKVVCKWLKELDDNTVQESGRIDLEEKEYKSEMKLLMEAVESNEKNAEYEAEKAAKKLKKSKKSSK